MLRIGSLVLGVSGLRCAAAFWPRTLAALILVSVGALSGCGGHQHGFHAVISVDAPTALVDQPVHIKVTGLPPGSKVTVSAEAADFRRQSWHGQVTFETDAHGIVDLDRAVPISGTYHRADGMGLFWSMEPPPDTATRSAFSRAFPPTRPATRSRSALPSASTRSRNKP
ncbi:acyl-CoA thioesterase/BAAT N-terminal domain-containing protein [Actinomadura napierensis]|uniref:Acyl-CoA thioester hydrolase/bile acid-CoA amino acid N-acetyltransferase domain-containing protein n=1 Tax=Actinomadura napierensis TaxID=267854 RepID=A0ABN2YGV5_9ACTN